MAASGCATCHADVSMASARGQQMLTSSLTWSTLTKSTVNGSTSMWGPRVSEAVSLTSGSRMSVWLKRKEKEKALGFLGSKGRQASSVWPERAVGRFGGSAHDSAGRLRFGFGC